MLFRLINVPFINVIVWLINVTPGHSAAVAIILFTILIRIILLVPNRHSILNQKKMQALQPEMNEIKKQYPDQKEQAQALMDLYAKNKISPFGSCLPMLVQLPILIALYQILQAGFGNDTLQFLYPFVARPEFINSNFFGLNLAAADHTYILPVLAIGLQLLQSLSLMMIGLKRGQKPQGMGLILFLTGMTFLVAIRVNAGVVLYWIISTIFGIAQQLIVGRNRVKLVHSDAVVNADRASTGSGATEPTKKVSAPPTAKQESGKSGVQLTIRRPGK
ncbi:MAG: YidC/Oxa1 family membrane protein insertase [bacterium]|nr:YidC/Oxa1 family membrane protein insertase [bacterium]